MLLTDTTSRQNAAYSPCVDRDTRDVRCANRRGGNVSYFHADYPNVAYSELLESAIDGSWYPKSDVGGKRLLV